MQRILISACLLGERVRFDGNTKKVDAPILDQWQAEGRLLILCPEVAGGLSVPRPPAEIQGSNIINKLGENMNQYFTQGAQKALSLCQKHHIRMAILKEGSPSCGVTQINDGSFSHTKTNGQGMTAKLLHKHDIQVFNEHQLEKAAVYFQSIL